MASKKKLILGTVAILSLGLVLAGTIPTLAAFASHKNLNRYTTAKRTIYLDLYNVQSDWIKDGARMAVYMYNSVNADFVNNGAFMDRVGNTVVYQTTVPASVPSGTKLIFCRFNNTCTSASNWDDVWNQTSVSGIDFPATDRDSWLVYNEKGTYGDDYGKYYGGIWQQHSSGNYSYDPSVS